ncbi:hypothetical protein T459_01995 [Capsicum annuum]|uniref:Protein ENHANCED DISEASE RESISTANCE 2 C-terminal domain-containing protein n=1 Tax=Capsicum annuum TaxID=4072 RepID=A0A2G3AIW7_CAPAN|nr:hypothetical protein T459_01995 [Capsicum annuum]
MPLFSDNESDEYVGTFCGYDFVEIHHGIYMASSRIRDKKEFALNSAAFYSFGADVFLLPQKIDHIARFVEIPVMDSSRKVSPILIVNLQIPLYPLTIFQNEYDGEGMSFVLYFRLANNYSKEMPVKFQENLQVYWDLCIKRRKINVSSNKVW